MTGISDVSTSIKNLHDHKAGQPQTAAVASLIRLLPSHLNARFRFAPTLVEATGTSRIRSD